MRLIQMSRPALTLSLAASCLLSGCSWFDAFRPFSYSRLPVPRVASERGATRTQVVLAGGNPHSVWMVRNGTGVCYNYLLERGDHRRPYYVVFDKAGGVTHRGFDSCMDADRKGQLQVQSVTAR